MIRKYVLTGNVCSGKSTTALELEKMGFSIIEEVATILTKENLKSGLPYPEKDTYEFQEKNFLRQKEYEECLKEDTFIDRSVIDILVFSKLQNVEYPKGAVEYIKNNRYDKIFLFEKLPFYEKCETRVSCEEKFSDLEPIIEDAYKSFGYDFIRVPYMSIKERAEFLINSIPS